LLLALRLILLLSLGRALIAALIVALIVALRVLSPWPTLAFVKPAGISLALAGTLYATALAGGLTLVWIAPEALTLISAAGTSAHSLASILIIFLILVTLILILSLILIPHFLVCHNTLLSSKFPGR
jgi:hypothetical protein